MQRALALTTVDDEEAAEGSVFALLDSLQVERADAVVVHRGGDDALRRRLAGHPAVLRVLPSEPVGISRARNIALQWASEHVPESAVVGFPDDDCTYPRGLLRRVIEELGRSDFVVGAYSPHVTRVDSRVFPAGRALLNRVPPSQAIASVGLFCRLGDVMRVGGFNERLGVGAEWDSGEEHDLVVRLIRSGLVGVYDPSLVVQHDYVRRLPSDRRVGWLGLNTAYANENRKFVPLAAKAWAALGIDVIRLRVPARNAANIARKSLDGETSRQVRAGYRNVRQDNQ